MDNYNEYEYEEQRDEFGRTHESYSWDALFIPDSLEPNKEIKQVNVRPKDYIEEDDN